MKSNGFNIKQGCVGAGCSTRWGCQLAQELHVGHEQRLCCSHHVGWIQECVPGLAPSATEPVFCTCTYLECMHTQSLHVHPHAIDAEGLCITRGVSVGPNTACAAGGLTTAAILFLETPRMLQPLLYPGHTCSPTRQFAEVPSC